MGTRRAKNEAGALPFVEDSGGLGEWLSLLGCASEFARRAGQSKSPAKAAAARVNGRKGGRPRRKAA